MVTAPANALIRTLTTEHAESDRMPAFLAKDDWANLAWRKWQLAPRSQNLSEDRRKFQLEDVEGRARSFENEARQADRQRSNRSFLTQLIRLSR